MNIGGALDCFTRFGARKPEWHAVSAQDCSRASTALLVTGEDPESEDGRLIVQVVEQLHQVPGS